MSLLKNRHLPSKFRRSVYESYVRSVLYLLHEAETWQMTEKFEDILKHCDRKMMRHTAGVRWTDRISSVEVAWRCGLTESRGKIRQRRLQWFGQVRREKDGGGLSRVEKMEVLGDMPRGKTKTNMEGDSGIRHGTVGCS